MKYTYQYRVKTSDLWQASMYYAYSSYLAIINIVCIVSSVALLIKLWPTSPGWFRVFLLLFLSLFTVIQPLLVFVRAKATLNGNYPELELTFEDDGMTIITGGQSEHRRWDQIRGCVSKPSIVIVYMADGNGYILRNSVLRDTKRELVSFIRQKLQEAKQN